MNLIMRATCPNCEATYELPAELAARLPASVRCARCGNAWEIQAEIETSAAPPVLPPASPAGPDAGAKAESKPDSIIESKPQQPIAVEPVPSGTEMPAPPKQPAGEKPAAKPDATTDRSRGEGKAGVGLAPAAMPLPVPEPVAAKPEATDAAEPDEEAPLPVSTVRQQWVISLVALAAVIALILVLHRPIGHAWPPMLRIYHTLGLE